MKNQEPTPTKEQRGLLAGLIRIAKKRRLKVVTRTCPPLNQDVPEFLKKLDAYENDPKRPSLMVTQPPQTQYPTRLRDWREVIDIDFPQHSVTEARARAAQRYAQRYGGDARTSMGRIYTS